MACPMTTAIELLNRIPSTFWGVLAGSFFSLGGVVLSNRNSARNQQRQLEHDRDTRRLEREMALRKDVYLAATESIFAGLSAVGSLSNLALDPLVILAEYRVKAPAVAKINIIAEAETLK